MKYLTIIFLLLLVQISQGQSESFPYQSILTDLDGTILNNVSTDVRINIRENSQDGMISYSEVHSIRSGDNGEIYLGIGTGNAVFQNFNQVDWRNPTYVELEIKPEGVNAFLQIANRRLLSVPYALFALKVTCLDGCPGAQGPKGADGMPGPRGATGAIGPTGPSGPTGSEGGPGEDGYSGAESLNITDLVPNPTLGRFYIDDGTNRADSNPGFRYYDGTNWIDL